MKALLQKIIRRGLPFMGIEWGRGATLQTLLRQEYALHLAAIRQATPHNPALHGFKCWSQFDEDGIIAFIASKLGLERGVFAEFGCGNGLENNSHLLLLKGWRGLWVDGSPQNAAYIRAHLPVNTGHLAFDDTFVRLDNVERIVADGLSAVSAQDLDLLSMDLDGNDAFLIERLLGSYKPKIVVAEYNGKLPFGLRLTVDYSDARWRTGDDFFGTSLSELIARMPGFTLVACGVSGVNAYFVRTDLAGAFASYEPRELYQPARTHLTIMSVGSPASLKFLAQQLRKSG